VLATEVANGLGIVVVLVEQPYRVAGRRSTPTPHLLDQAWVPVVEQLRAGPLAGLPVVTGGRSSGARGGQRPCRSCRIATATMLELAPIWVHWHDAGARQLPMCVRGSPYGTLRSMPLVADWR